MSSFNPFGGDRTEPELKSIAVARFALWSDAKQCWIESHTGAPHLYVDAETAAESLQWRPEWREEGFRVVRVEVQPQ